MVPKFGTVYNIAKEDRDYVGTDTGLNFPGFTDRNRSSWPEI